MAPPAGRFGRLAAAFRRLLAVPVLFLAGAAGCAALPDTDLLITQHGDDQAPRFEAGGSPVPARQSAAIVASLKSRSGDIDILDKQIALEQAIVGSPLVLGNTVSLLQDGPATYTAMLEAIAAARDHVHLETYILDDDEIGQKFAELLLARRQAGVEINLIYDSFGCLNTPPAFFERLRQGGINVLEFNPLNPLGGGLPWLVNHRDHRKLLVVDGRVAFLGGINISSVYTAGSGSHRQRKASAGQAVWRDTHVRIEGPAVGELQKLFLETWHKQGGPAPGGQQHFPVLAPTGTDIVRAIGSTPDDPFSQIYVTLISAITHAEREIHLTNAYFVPDAQLLAALTEATARGVAVSLILPSFSDSAVVLHAGRQHYEMLLKAGVRIYERRGALLHAKTALIDGVWSSVGSANLDWRSFADNDEVVAVILGRAFAGQMRAMIDRDVAASSQISLEAWERRSLLQRLKEWGAGLLRRLL